ncbi:MAG: 23S rRNA (uracil(1939)-C(5))-methyltransferase RlmD [Granulosicoccaceae bacterium]|jgi:23S rRNA (uracil1939-C5)-methyltransferase
MARRRKKLPVEPVLAEIESLDHDGRGVAHIDGKVVFIDNALPGEQVMFCYTQQRRKFDQGRVVEVLKASADRVTPKCPHFGVCGGCALQHMSNAAQIRHKQQVLAEQLQHIGKITVPDFLPALVGKEWGYRRKARLGVRYAIKKEQLMVGFRERYGRFITEMDSCEVLDASVGKRIALLKQLIASLHAYDRIAQIEVAVGDNATALVFRNLVELDEQDRQALMDFARAEGVQVWLQPKGPETIYPLWPDDAQLYYELPEYDVHVDFLPVDFTQVNGELNRKMVAHALGLLELSAEQTVLDLFCGLGNFTMPLSRKVKQVIAIEGSESLVERAHANASRNGIENVEYHVADLFQGLPEYVGRAERVLLDPPRSGAFAIVSDIERIAPQRIVYVSCNTATLARDAGVLVNDKGYRLVTAGIMDMFPHTAHAEAIAMFEKP